MNKGSLMPKIRFVNFKGDWEKCKLGEISTLSSSKRIHLSDYVESGVPFYRGSEITNGGISGQNKLFITESLYIKIKEKYGVPIEGDLLITAVGTLGNVWKVDNSKFYYKDGNLIRISNLSVTSNYLSSYLSDNPGKKILLDSAAGSNQKALTMVKMRDIEIPVSSFEEQTKIGEFFMQLDDIIILQQQLLNDHKQLKKVMLQKMFPQKGETVPRVRFDEFNSDWKELKLGKVLSEMKSGLSRMLSNNDIGLPVIRANNINNGNLNLNNHIKYWYVDDPQGANTGNYIIYKNDILVNFINSEAKMGTAAIVNKEPGRDTIYTTNILRLRVNSSSEAYFIFSLTMTDKYKYHIKSITKAAVNQASFTTVDFKNCEFMIPQKEEQTKIGNFFKQLDETIVLYEKTLETYQNLKKAMLQKMFV